MIARQNDSFGEAIQGFFTQKKAERTDKKIIVQRLRGAPPNNETFESELNKAENELLKVMQVCE